MPETREGVRLAPDPAVGVIGASSKFGTGSGNYTGVEGWFIRTGVPEGRRREGGGVVSRNLGQGEDCHFLVPFPHDIVGRAGVRPCPVDWLITYLRDRKATRHSQGGCEPEYDRFEDRRSEIVKCYDIGYPRSGPPCIIIGEGFRDWRKRAAVPAENAPKTHP